VNETSKGYSLGGADVIVSVYVMHRHPSLWKAPHEFRPSRFLDDSEDRLHHDKLPPFSRWHRDCIGKYFALLEAKLAVSAFVILYDLECVDPNETIYAQLTNQPKSGAKIRIRKREPGSY
jgi:cytochrome P450